MAGIQSLDAFLAKIIKRNIADINNDGSISEKEEALFTYMNEAKNLSDSLVLTNEDGEYNSINWTNVNNKLIELQIFGDLTMASSTAAMMQSLDTDKDGRIEDSEISSQSSNQNIINMNAIFGTEDENASEEMFSFTNLLNYAQLVNTDNDTEITTDEASTFGTLVSSANGVKLRDSDNVITKADFLATLKKHIKGESLTSEQEAIIKNIQTGKYVAAPAPTPPSTQPEIPDEEKALVTQILGVSEDECTWEDSTHVTINNISYIVLYTENTISLSYEENGTNYTDLYDNKGVQLKQNVSVNEQIDAEYTFTDGEKDEIYSLKFAPESGKNAITNVKNHVVNPDGTITVTFSDGSTKIYNADGSEKVEQQDPPTTNPPSTNSPSQETTTTYNAEAGTLTFPNGTTINVPEGYAPILDSDNNVVLEADGTVKFKDTNTEDNIDFDVYFNNNEQQTKTVRTENNYNGFEGLAHVETTPFSNGIAGQTTTVFNHKNTTLNVENVRFGSNDMLILTEQEGNVTTERHYNKSGIMQKSVVESLTDNNIRNVQITEYTDDGLFVATRTNYKKVGEDLYDPDLYEFSLDASSDTQSLNVTEKNKNPFTTVNYQYDASSKHYQKISTSITTKDFEGIKNLERVAITPEPNQGTEPQLMYKYNGSLYLPESVSINNEEKTVSITSLDGNIVSTYDKDSNKIREVETTRGAEDKIVIVRTTTAQGTTYVVKCGDKEIPVAQNEIPSIENGYLVISRPDNTFRRYDAEGNLMRTPTISADKTVTMYNGTVLNTTELGYDNVSVPNNKSYVYMETSDHKNQAYYNFEGELIATFDGYSTSVGTFSINNNGKMQIGECEVPVGSTVSFKEKGSFIVKTPDGTETLYNKDGTVYTGPTSAAGQIITENTTYTFEDYSDVTPVIERQDDGSYIATFTKNNNILQVYLSANNIRTSQIDTKGGITYTYECYENGDIKKKTFTQNSVQHITEYETANGTSRETKNTQIQPAQNGITKKETKVFSYDANGNKSEILTTEFTFEGSENKVSLQSGQQARIENGILVITEENETEVNGLKQVRTNTYDNSGVRQIINAITYEYANGNKIGLKVNENAEIINGKLVVTNSENKTVTTYSTEGKKESEVKTTTNALNVENLELVETTTFEADGTTVKSTNSSYKLNGREITIPQGAKIAKNGTGIKITGLNETQTLIGKNMTISERYYDANGNLTSTKAKVTFVNGSNSFTTDITISSSANLSNIKFSVSSSVQYIEIGKAKIAIGKFASNSSKYANEIIINDNGFVSFKGTTASCKLSSPAIAVTNDTEYGSSADGAIIREKSTLSDGRAVVTTKNYKSSTLQKPIVTTIGSGSTMSTVIDNNGIGTYPNYDNGVIKYGSKANSATLDIPEGATVTINSASDVQVKVGNETKVYSSKATVQTTLIDNREGSSSEYPKMVGSTLYLAEKVSLTNFVSGEIIHINADGKITIQGSTSAKIGSTVVPAGATFSVNSDGQLIITTTKTENNKTETVKKYYTETTLKKIVTTIVSNGKTTKITDTNANTYPNYENGVIQYSTKSQKLTVPEGATVKINSASDVQVKQGNVTTVYSDYKTIAYELTDNRETTSQYPYISGDYLYYASGKKISTKLNKNDKVTINADGTFKVLHKNDTYEIYNSAGTKIGYKTKTVEFMDNRTTITKFPYMNSTTLYYYDSNNKKQTIKNVASATINANGTLTYKLKDGTEKTVNYVNHS